MRFWHSLGWVVVLSATILFATSCDVQKKQAQAFKKFVKYGGKVDCNQDTLWQYDTNYVAGEIVIDSFPLPCNCPEVSIGYTDKQLRMILRHQKDSMKYLLKLAEIRADKLADSLDALVKLEKEKTKQNKSDDKLEKKKDDNARKVETKGSNALVWYLLGVLTVPLLYFLYAVVIRRFI